MRSLPWSTIIKALRTNPAVVLLPSRTTKGAMVYIRTNHPDADHRGLWEIMAIPSPTFFERCPAFDFIDAEQTSKQHPIGKHIPGYIRFFKNACNMRGPDGFKIFKREEIQKIIPDAFRMWKHKLFKDDYKNMSQTDFEKFYKKIPWRKIPGYGDPVHYRKSSRVITF